MVTTAYPYHSPEVEYLEPGLNGLITANTMESFTTGALQVLQSGELRGRLQAEGLRSAREYTLEAMVGNFREGVAAALRAPRLGQI